MRKEIPLIALGIFCMIILLAQNNIEKVYAVSIEIATFGAVGTITSTQYKDCEYVSSTIVWCPSTTGAKIWNPTSRTVTSTVYSGIDISSIECDSTYCFTWHQTSADNIGNLTMFLKTGGAVIDSYSFPLGTGGITGYGITLVPAQGGSTTTILTLVEGQTCLDGVVPLGNTDEKGICFIAVEPTNPFPLDGTRFISSGATSDTAVTFDIRWNGEFATIGDPTANRAVAKFRDAAGNFQYYNINLADSDTTFALTQICNSGTVSGGLTQNRLFMFNGIIYDGVNNDIWTMDSTNSSCSEVQKTNLVDESVVTGVSYSSSDDLFFVTSTTDASIETNSLNVFNGTTFGASASFDRLLKLNLTSTSGNTVWTSFPHQAEGEVHVWRGSDMVIVTELLTPSNEGQTTTICYVVQGTGQTFCKTYDLDENGNIILDSVIGGVNPRNITTTNNELFCSLGLTDCANPDIKTNGTGMFMLLILLLVSYALVVYIHHVAKQSIMGIHPMLVLLIGIIDISIAFFLGWIPDYVFYSVIVLLVGLGGFGLYKIIRGM